MLNIKFNKGEEIVYDIDILLLGYNFNSYILEDLDKQTSSIENKYIICSVGYTECLQEYKNSIEILKKYKYLSVLHGRCPISKEGALVFEPSDEILAAESFLNANSTGPADIIRGADILGKDEEKECVYFKK